MSSSRPNTARRFCTTVAWKRTWLSSDYNGGDTATVYCSTQGTFSIPNDAATALGIKPSNVTGIVHHMGGGFGTKGGIGVEGQLACELFEQVRAP